MRGDGADNLIAYGSNNYSGSIEVATVCNAHGGPHGRLDFGSETFVAHSLRADGFDASEDGTGRGTPIVAFHATQDPIFAEHALPLESSGGYQAVAFAENSRAELRLEGGDGRTVGSLKVGGGKAGQSYPAICIKGAAIGRQPQNSPQYGETLTDGTTYTLNATEQHGVMRAMSVRRLTPRECERLQGFPDDWTAVGYRGKPAADGPRYRALGNSMAVPVMRWILDRVRLVDGML